MSDYVTSLIRTWVPAAVAFLATWLATKLGVVIDEETQAQGVAFLTMVLTGVYYGLVRLLEKKNYKFGWLLGRAKAPTY